MINKMHIKNKTRLSAVAYAYIPSYSGGGD
jgi:hypothetical protein